MIIIFSIIMMVGDFVISTRLYNLNRLANNNHYDVKQNVTRIINHLFEH